MTKTMTDEEAVLLACRTYDWDWPGMLRPTDRIVIIGRLLADIDRLTRERDAEISLGNKLSSAYLGCCRSRDIWRQEAERLRRALMSLVETPGSPDLEGWPNRRTETTWDALEEWVPVVIAEGSTLYAEDGDG